MVIISILENCSKLEMICEKQFEQCLENSAKFAVVIIIDLKKSIYWNLLVTDVRLLEIITQKEHDSYCAKNDRHELYVESRRMGRNSHSSRIPESGVFPFLWGRYEILPTGGDL